MNTFDLIKYNIVHGSHFAACRPATSNASIVVIIISPYNRTYQFYTTSFVYYSFNPLRTSVCNTHDNNIRKIN